MDAVAAIIRCSAVRSGRDMAITQHEKDVNTARIESELDLAARIQNYDALSGTKERGSSCRPWHSRMNGVAGEHMPVERSMAHIYII